MIHDPASTRRHESAHAAACLWLGAGRRITCVRVDHPDPNALGRMSSELDREINASDFAINVIGWMADGTHPGEWPPPWPVDEDAADGIGLLVRHLKLNEYQYQRLIQVAEELLADPDFQRLMRLIDRPWPERPSSTPRP